MTSENKIKELLGDRVFAILKKEMERQGVEFPIDTPLDIIRLIDIDKAPQGHLWWAVIGRIYIERYASYLYIDRLTGDIRRISRMIDHIRSRYDSCLENLDKKADEYEGGHTQSMG